MDVKEARERLLTGCCSAEPWRSPVGSSFDESKPVNRLAAGVLASRHLATGVPQPGDGGAHGVRQPAELLPILATDAPSGRSSMPISTARFVLTRGPSASCTAGVAKSAPSEIGSDCEAWCSSGSVAFFDSPMHSEAPSGTTAGAAVEPRSSASRFVSGSSYSAGGGNIRAPVFGKFSVSQHGFSSCLRRSIHCPGMGLPPGLDRIKACCSPRAAPSLPSAGVPIIPRRYGLW